jgi:hypothetical protein
MTKTRIGIGVLGSALALTWVAWGMQATAQPMGRGHFRLTLGAGSGTTTAINCFDRQTMNPCKPAPMLPGLPIVSVTSISIFQMNEAKGPVCFMEHNGSYFEVPC